ncbi:MAG: beta-glucosidase [Nitrospirae bacterium]|nr:beta-glucosidase [Fimbriimonadaceae bacterium]
MQFPPNFLWGAATASFQIEGAVATDGKGPSVWDMLCQRPGAVFEGHTGDPACDHYHRMTDDVAMMAELGLQAYRFSISWPRVLPEGVGRVNARGLEFYDRLVDTLLAKGIAPYPTLFHWDYPLALYARGGWLHEDSPEWFAEYTQVMVDKLSDRVSNWMTQNEPQCFVGLGHSVGVHAPGLKLPWPEYLTVLKNSLLAHGKSVQVIRASAKTKPSVSFAPVGHGSIPASDSPEDIAAARAHDDNIKVPGVWYRSLHLDPAILGVWPEDADRVFGAYGMTMSDSDLKTICQPLDWLGLNFYSAPTVKAGPDGQPVVVKYPAGHPQNAMGWPITPEGIYWMVKFHYERYGLPIVITENGMANLDAVDEDGGVHDPQRIAYTRNYLKQLHRAIQDGIDVRGYFHWSLMDNFEWAEGYSKRFGLVHVDYATQKRTPKDSAYWYREVIRSNGEALKRTDSLIGV